MTLENVIYTILRIISAGIGLYAAIYFYRLCRRLKQPPYSKFPFIMLALANFGAFIIYTLAVLGVDGFGAISNTGKVVQVLVLIYQVMPPLIAHGMEKTKWI